VVDGISAKTQRFEFEAELDGQIVAGKSRSHLAYVAEVRNHGREQQLVKMLREVARPGSTVVDGGAYIGYLTLQLAAAVGPTGCVLAVEPEPQSLKMLRENIEINGYVDRVETFAVALGETHAEAVFYSALSPDMSSLYAAEAPHQRIAVTVMTGDALFGERDIDVIKLDLEGGEVSALRGMRKLLERCQPVLFVECNRVALAAAGSSDDALVRELIGAGYKVGWIDEHAGTVRSIDETWASEYVNLFCEPLHKSFV
jgi:FkbM family methyltransferase